MQRNRCGRALAPSLLIAAALMVLLVGCGGDSSAPSAGAPTTVITASGADSPDTAALYSDRCASCHGADGEGGGGPALLGKNDATLIEKQIAEGVGLMPGYGDKLSAPEITALAEYVAALE